MRSIPMNSIDLNTKRFIEKFGQIKAQQVYLSEEGLKNELDEPTLHIQLQVSVTEGWLVPVHHPGAAAGNDNNGYVITGRRVMPRVVTEFPVDMFWRCEDGDRFFYHNIDELVSNRVLSTHASDVLKAGISDLAAEYGPKSLHAKRKRILVTVPFNVERVYIPGAKEGVNGSEDGCMLIDNMKLLSI